MKKRWGISKSPTSFEVPFVEDRFGLNSALHIHYKNSGRALMRKKNGKQDVADRDWWTLVRVVIQRVSICSRGEGFVINTFRICVLRPVGEGEGPKIWKVWLTKPSPPWNAAQFFFPFLSGFFLFYILIVIKYRNGSPEAPQCDIVTVEWISQGTRTTLTDYMGPSLLKKSKEKMMENKSQRWNQKLYLPDFGRISDLYCTFWNPEGTVKLSR
jgi:hypothetical protein